MSEGVLVAVIGALALMYAATLPLLVSARKHALNAAQDAALARYEVKNDHKKNLREEADERHTENARKLDDILAEIAALRGSVRRVWRRLDRHTDAIHRLELDNRTAPTGGLNREEEDYV